MKLSTAIASLTIFSVLITVTSTAEDWPQWRGINRDGISPETGLLTEWPPNGPSLLWSATGIGDGYSSVTIANGTVYVTGMKGDKEVISAFDLNGNLKWQKEYGTAWKKSFPGTRGSVTVDGDALYAITGVGEVVCMDAATGDIRWSVNGFEKFGGKSGPWGVAESPLIVDDKVIYTPAGKQTTIVALNKKTGETVWMSKSLNDKTGYVSPILIERNGRRQIVQVTGKFIFGVNPDTGEIEWEIKYKDIPPPKGGGDINICSPLYHDGRVYVTSGYNHVGVMIQLSDDLKQADVLWTDSTLDVHHGGVVLVNGHIYGANWINNKDGNWVCIDWETGKPSYETKWHTKGSIISAEGMLYCYEEKDGNFALVRATPDEFAVVSSFQITQGNGQHWAHPAISDGVLYVRHGDALMAYDIKK